MVLSKYGGVFIDVDFICLKPFDELVYRYEYFSGFEPKTSWTSVPVINQGLHASAKDSKIMKQLKLNMERYIKDKKYVLEVNEYTDMIIQYGKASKGQNLVRVTLESLCNNTDLCPGVVPFSPSYFESPFMFFDLGEHAQREFYSILDLLIVVLVQYSYSDGALWWFEGSPEMDQIVKNQSAIRIVRWVVDSFMPLYLERERF